MRRLGRAQGREDKGRRRQKKCFFFPAVCEERQAVASAFQDTCSHRVEGEKDKGCAQCISGYMLTPRCAADA
jgi:hypothetical protein